MLVLAGCVQTTNTPTRATPVTGSVKEEASLDIDVENPRTVAVMPFANGTPAPQAGDTVRRLFFNFFSSLNYSDIELFVVDKALSKAGLADSVRAGEASYSELCQAVGADAIVLGDVTAYGKMFAVLYGHRQVTLKAEMIHCTSGKVFWTNEETVLERDVAVSFDVVGIALGIVKNLVSHANANILNTASELSMKIVSTIPNPLEVAEPPPRIQMMLHNGSGKFISPGDELRMVLVGDPGLEANWKPTRDIDRLPLTEQAPGLYTGAYTVLDTDKVVNGHPIGFLTSRKGSTARWIDVTDGVNFGASQTMPGFIERNRTLTAAEGPFIISRFLVIPDGVTLTVGPGTNLWTESGGIIVRGVLDIKGSKDAPVRLYGNANDRWKGILIDKAKSASRIHHAIIADAENGLKARASAVDLEQVEFIGNRWGLVIDGGSMKMRGGSIRLSKKVGLSAKNATLDIAGARIFENEGGGIQFQGTDLNVRNNDILNNGKWDARNLDDNSSMSLPDNWWGITKSASARLKGGIVIEPMLQNSVTRQKDKAAP
jgi:hypothetical protein